MKSSRLVFAVVAAAACLSGADGAEARLGFPVDSGGDAKGTSELVSSMKTLVGDESPSLVRIRGLEQVPPDTATIRDVRSSLQRTRAAGCRVVVILRWPVESWTAGGRQPARSNRLPADLREAFERCRALAVAYGDLVDYWEIENEPDISFVEENPETYTAFLKACYLGIEKGRRETRATEGVSSQAASRVLMAPLALPPGPYFEAFVANDGLSYTDGFNYHYYGYAEDFTGVYRQFQDAVQRLAGPRSGGGASLPQGSAAGISGGTDARYNKEQADLNPETLSVNRGSASGRGAAVWRSRFFPNAPAWPTEVTAGFSHPERQADIDRALQRPRAIEEPVLTQQGRWLVSDGLKVEETAEAWTFTIERWPDGPLHAPMAELPLPTGWSLVPESFVQFEYRTASMAGANPVSAADALDAERLSRKAVQAKGSGVGAPRPQLSFANVEPDSGAAVAVPGAHEAATNRRPGASGGSDPGYNKAKADLNPETLNPKPCRAAAGAARELPIFLTEYGYGELDKVTRNTAEGRERQRAWFASVREQIRELGIEGAMAFVLNPYLETGLQEYGLLMERPLSAAVASTGGNSPTRIGTYFASPAFEEMIRTADLPLAPKRWSVATPPPSSVVIDFIAEEGLIQAKSYGGYFLEGQHGQTAAAKGELAVYNFGAAPVTGYLMLDGDAWALSESEARSGVPSERSIALALQPRERRVIPVYIWPRLDRFAACPVTARFEQRAIAGPTTHEPEELVPNEQQARENGPPVAVSIGGRKAAQPPTSAPKPKAPFHRLECYFRTDNGNLYQTWPRLFANSDWQRYMEPVEDFTMAFYGRTNLPWRFLDNRPVSFVLMFHPSEFPATVQIRRVQMVRYSQVSAARKP